MAKLTEKQQRFINEYLIDLNATQAAIRAGYSKKNASRIAIELLNKTHVSDYLQKRQRQRIKRTEITQDMVIEELSKVAFAESTDFSFNGIPKIPEADHKTGSKLKALELLGRHIGMFDKTPGGSNDENPDNLIQAIEQGVDTIFSEDKE